MEENQTTKNYLKYILFPILNTHLTLTERHSIMVFASSTEVIIASFDRVVAKNGQKLWMHLYGRGGARGPSPPPFFGMYIGSKIIKSWFLKLQKFHFEKGSVTPYKNYQSTFNEKWSIFWGKIYINPSPNMIFVARKKSCYASIS